LPPFKKQHYGKPEGTKTHSAFMGRHYPNNPKYNNKIGSIGDSAHLIEAG